VIGWEAYDIFRVEGFPLQRPDWRVMYCNGLLYACPTHVTLWNFLIRFTFFTATYLTKARYSLFVLRVSNQSVSFYLIRWTPQWATEFGKRSRGIWKNLPHKTGP